MKASASSLRRLPRYQDAINLVSDGDPGPQVADAIGSAQVRLEVALLRVAVTPDFVKLEPLALQAAQRFIEIRFAGVAHVGQEAEGGFLVDPDHAAGSTDRVPLNERREGLNAEGEREAVHTPYYARAVSHSQGSACCFFLFVLLVAGCASARCVL